MSKERKVERLENGEWKPIIFADIKKGDTYRLFDEDPDPIETGEPYIAESDAFLGENNVWTVL